MSSTRMGAEAHMGGPFCLQVYMACSPLLQMHMAWVPYCS